MTKTNTISQTDVLTAVTVYTKEQNRPCPSHFLTEKFGADVLDVVDELKETGVLLGLRGRNGGLALPGTEIVAKRSEFAAKKAAKLAAKASEAPAVEADEPVAEAV